MSIFADEYDDDGPTEAECFYCQKRVELYAPGESYTIRCSMPVHLSCAEEIDTEERQSSGALADYDGEQS